MTTAKIITTLGLLKLNEGVKAETGHELFEPIYRFFGNAVPTNLSINYVGLMFASIVLYYGTFMLPQKIRKVSKILTGGLFLILVTNYFDMLLPGGGGFTGVCEKFGVLVILIVFPLLVLFMFFIYPAINSDKESQNKEN